MKNGSPEAMWKIKLAAWLHDPPEKALVLWCPEGHEGGTVASLLTVVFGTDELPAEFEEIVRRADRWAAAADRPDRPGAPGGQRWAVWDRIRFPDDPALRHPLSGQHYDLRTLREVQPEHARQLATDHLTRLLEKSGDDRTRFLRLWRFAPEIDAPEIRSLWRLLPADTRVPDHSIWDHLGLTSAFAGAMCEGDGPALLAVAIGPVQSFIEQGRSTSDLWAGSHLLSALTWEAMLPVVEACGPDAVVFPSLRGVPLCDAWLVDSGAADVSEIRDREAAWKRGSDAHPLFAAALPNRFVAIVPVSRAAELGDAIERHVRSRALEWGRCAWERIRSAVELEGDHGSTQLAEQLTGFPEVHWAAVPWPHADAAAEMEQQLRGWSHSLGGGTGFLDGPGWQLLSKEILVEGARFYVPNPGVLYPVVHELAERALAAAKARRAFDQLRQCGYRCSLCGEREWLAGDTTVVQSPRNEKGRGDPWPRITGERRSWARGTEHLCAICTLKRVWPAIFTDRVRALLADGEGSGVRRYVVSTHTMALAPSLERLKQIESGKLDAIEGALGTVAPGWVALPRRLAGNEIPRDLARRLPAALDALDDEIEAARGCEQRLRELSDKRMAIERAWKDAIGARLETYYALLLLDGDHMGAWVAGGEDGRLVGRPSYGELWHPVVATAVRQAFADNEAIEGYLTARAPASPGYHAALSRAVNDFALRLVPVVVEEVFRGKVLYAGGDDVLAMLPVRDLLPTMLLLRTVWSGTLPASDQEIAWLVREKERAEQLRVGGGHVQVVQDLFRALGRNATCSIGAVVAHHTAPLSAVLTELRVAERRAKRAGGDAFSITLDKRAGGTTHLTCSWALGQSDGSITLQASPMGGLLGLLRALEQGDVSRQAVYLCASWLESLAGGSVTDTDMLAELLGHQLVQGASKGGDKEQRRTRNAGLRELARNLAQVAMHGGGADPAGWLLGIVRHAEFLARTERAGPPFHRGGQGGGEARR